MSAPIPLLPYRCDVAGCPVRYAQPGQTCISHRASGPLVCDCDEPDSDNWLGECRTCRRKDASKLRA